MYWPSLHIQVGTNVSDICMLVLTISKFSGEGSSGLSLFQTLNEKKVIYPNMHVLIWFFGL